MCGDNGQARWMVNKGNKTKWVTHIALTIDVLWESKVLEWQPRTDNIKKISGSHDTSSVRPCRLKIIAGGLCPETRNMYKNLY